jgi:hypothetical protein
MGRFSRFFNDYAKTVQKCVDKRLGNQINDGNYKKHIPPYVSSVA